MNELQQDVRYAFRSLRRSPGFATVAVLTLALGIGANSAVFSVLDGVVLRPLGYREPGRLVSIASRFPTLGFERFWISPPEYFELKEWSRSFSAIGGYRAQQASVGGGESPERVTNAFATADLFTVLGVPALIGRAYTAEEDLPGAEPVAVLSYELWQRTFGGARDILERSILVNGVSTRVAGVMPPGFDVEDADIEIWQPLQLDPANRQNRGSHFLNLVARLGPGVSFARAEAELAQLVARWRETVPNSHTPTPDNHPFFLTDLQETLIGNVRPALLLLLGAVGFVLLIACANVGNLLLVRAEARQKEIAVRAALGAGRRRLLRQFLTEGVVLAVIGGALGMALGHVGVRLLLATSPESVPRADEIALDPRVLLFTLLVSIVTGLLFGLAPIFHLGAARLNSALREGGQRATAGAGRHAIRRALVAAELALAVILLVGAGLMLRSFEQLQKVAPGFQPDGLVAFQLFMPAATYPDAATTAGFLDRVLDRVRGLPGVTGVAAMQGLPPRREVNANDTEFENVAGPPDGPPQNVDYYQTVTADYLRTMGIPVVRGRGFEPADANSPSVLVNERLAGIFYPGQDPVGRRIRAFGPDSPWLTILGVVADVKQGGLEAETGTELYFMYEQGPVLFDFAPRSMYVVARTSGDAGGLLSAIPREVRALDPAMPVSQLQLMREAISTSMAQPRFLTLLLGIFAAVALALATIGTYGVIAYSVLERRQEIGIRMAMGARAASVVRMILGQALAVAAVGLALGVAGAFALTRLLRSLLFNVSETDPSAFVLAPLVLALVASVACLLPALRAATVDPARVLKD
jgi:putative ABC transport system permease protein